MASSESFIERLQSRAIVTLWRVLSGWRPVSLWRLARLIGPLVRRFSQRERLVTRVNLNQAYPELAEPVQRRLVRDSLVHSSATMLELGFAWLGDAQRVSDSIQEVHGRELLDDARARGQGVIVLAPHFGNWEVLNFWLSSHFPFTAMYEPPKLAALDPIIRQGRERQGARLVPTNPRGVAALLKALNRTEAVGILPDQEPGWGSGVFAPFFGRQAYTATLLPKLVARTEARVVTGVARRLPGRGFAIHFLAADERVYESDERTSAAGVNACVEAAIALDPAQYQWEYKRYRKTPEEAEQRPDWKHFRLYR
ncbi:lysophospholipid acyltransferase family protein [Halomonas elongata]|uniref:Lysophospholipid acyltransferase family protein n=1 Tax=Halomonas elongata (strain ATCC 33173 / DSM 2581 / NBRC 15536 / NCIMB 2198 / 1H9) TaxID=768066 RepID=E1V573_HALED|nr:lysophospholipid acyltransferase family protein [Halomonas elongata]MBW5799879.1 lysophospholipid acyltransferase family protein [Halomonas elongata]MDL4863804.1 lysophospholipid acyltransferase family protein [Halomonas elongata]RAW08015.1 lipid A biosynthesis acyltransferase [Halomonas elongata]WBF16769.1 lysophospholipid acyltransferase family protein [Halomonas elongata]WPU45600.1 lysophospholipid acyltransferase family protein [Halomonas elongata DSM 2581]